MKRLVYYIQLIISLTKLLFSYCLSVFVKLDDIWLISERGYEAKDNGYFFFLFLKKYHPEIDVRYVISNESTDVHKFINCKNDIVDYGSLSHYIIFWKSTHLISTHPMGCSPIRQEFFLNKLHAKYGLLKNKKHIFLQHGIIKDDLPILYSENMKLDLFICGAKPEYNYVYNNFHYSDDVVKYTGLCRYDRLNEFKTKSQILIMPTWRKYIDRNKFEESDYYKRYRGLLLDYRFSQILKANNLRAIFYLHYAFQNNIGSFEKLPLTDEIIIADSSFDVQTLLKESKLLISDYSSVYFDMAYMHKPILLYQFDEIEYRSKHYKEGYFKVTSIAEKYENLEDLISGLQNAVSRNYMMQDKHVLGADELFELRDNHNCDRVFNAIINLS